MFDYQSCDGANLRVQEIFYRFIQGILNKEGNIKRGFFFCHRRTLDFECFKNILETSIKKYFKLFLLILIEL